MNLLLDTNRYRDFCEGDPVTVDRVQLAEGVCLAFVTVAELRAGFRSGTRAQQNEANLGRFLQAPRVAVVYAGETTTHHFAALFAQLRRQGTPIPTHDIWIAALALEHNLALFSRDQHFDHLPQVPRIH